MPAGSSPLKLGLCRARRQQTLPLLNLTLERRTAKRSEAEPSKRSVLKICDVERVC